MTAQEIVTLLPAHVALGLGAGADPELTAEQVRDRLAAIGRADPEQGHTVADELMRCALWLIAEGHARPDVIARAALTADSAEFPRWFG